MPLSTEQKKHLEDNWQNIQMRANDDAALKQNELLFLARAKNNAAAIPIAYSDAALFRLETTVRNQLTWTLSELEAMDVVVDREAEQFVTQHFNVMTSMSMPLHFPPGLTATMDISAHQGAHVRARMRLNNQLQREAASAIRSLSLKARSVASTPTIVINNHFNNSPGARSYYQSTDNSINEWKAPGLAVEMASLSKGNPELESISSQIQGAHDKKSMADQLTKWVAVASGIEALGEKLHTILPVIQAWFQHHSSN
ncbi:hypothetical protein BH10ACI4_BH10ACI4_03790 [soil metagenome]